jgi:hypothetical protein
MKSPLDWLAGDSKPNAFGYRPIDPVRLEALYAALNQADARRARAKERTRSALKGWETRRKNHV